MLQMHTARFFREGSVPIWPSFLHPSPPFLESSKPPTTSLELPNPNPSMPQLNLPSLRTTLKPTTSPTRNANLEVEQRHLLPKEKQSKGPSSSAQPMRFHKGIKDVTIIRCGRCSGNSLHVNGGRGGECAGCRWGGRMVDMQARFLV